MDYKEINDYLVNIFNNVLVIEESALKTGRFQDISIKEMHTIDVIGSHPNCTPSAVASSLMVTMGTVTTSLNRLENKGYITRERSQSDRRVVHLNLTKKGRLVYKLHYKFHRHMVMELMSGMDEQETEALQSGLKRLHDFLEELK